MKHKLWLALTLILLLATSGTFAPIFNPGGGAGGGSNHNMLSSTHSDSTGASGVSGDLIRFNSTWERFGIGTSGQCLIVSGGLPTWGACSAGGAPSTATYITQTSDGALSAEQALGALASGCVSVTTTTGVLASSSKACGTWLGTATSGILKAASQDNLVAATAGTDYAGVGVANSWADGIRQTFNPNDTNAGFNPGANTNEPSAAVNGDEYYNSTTNKKRCFENSAWIDCSGGNKAPNNATYITQTANADLTAEQALSTLASGCLNVTNGTGVIGSTGATCGGGNLVVVTVDAGNSPYTTLVSDQVIRCDTTAANRTINLITAASHTGLHYWIKNIGTNQCTTTAAGVELIDGAVSAVLTMQYEAIEVNALTAATWDIF